MRYLAVEGCLPNWHHACTDDYLSDQSIAAEDRVIMKCDINKRVMHGFSFLHLLALNGECAVFV